MLGSTIKNITKLLLSSGTSLVLLSLFSLVFNYTGVHVTNKEGFTDYRWESRQFFSTMLEGYSWFKFDKYGFNNAYPYAGQKDDVLSDRNIDVLLMGSSHMEAVQFAPEYNTGYLLNSLNPILYTYNIGISGHNINTCMKNLAIACENLHPQKCVVIETSSYILNKDTMNKVLENKLPTIKSYDSGLMYVIQKTVPGIKLLYKKFDEWGKVDVPRNKSFKRAVLDYEYINTLNQFMARAAKIVQQYGVRLVIFYHPTFKLGTDGKLINNIDKTYMDAYKQACQNKGIKFVDLTKSTEELYTQERILTHGFNNTAVGVGHLNEAGHRMIAVELDKILSKWGREDVVK